VKVVRLKMTPERRVCLGLADVKRYGVLYLEVELLSFIS